MPPKRRTTTAYKRALQKAAQEDTPDFVNFMGGDWTKILTWLFGRFGIATVFIYSSWMLYQDQKVDKAFYINSYQQTIERINEERSRENKANSELIDKLSKAIEENTRAINSAHYRTQQ